MIKPFFDQFVASLPPDLASFPHVFGRLSLDENSSYPRVAWVPAGNDRFTPGVNTAGYRSLFTREASVEIHFWGADDTAAEAIMEEYLALLTSMYSPSVITPHGGYFLTEQERAAANQNDGSVYVLALSISQPIIKPQTFVVLTGIALDSC